MDVALIAVVIILLYCDFLRHHALWFLLWYLLSEWLKMVHLLCFTLAAWYLLWCGCYMGYFITMYILLYWQHAF